MHKSSNKLVSYFHFTSYLNLTHTPHTLILPLFHHQPQFNFPCYTRKNLPSEAGWRLTGVIFRPLIDDIGGGGVGNDVWSTDEIVHSNCMCQIYAAPKF